jgi:hypothetical protein
MRTVNYPRKGYQEIIESGLKEFGLKSTHVGEARQRAFKAATTRFPGITPEMAVSLRDRLYFSYGSNLDFCLMDKRSAGAQPIDVVWAYGYEFEYYGFATIVPASNKKTGPPGVLWLVQDWMTLDQCEGVPSLYTREWMQVVTRHGKWVDCQCYFHTDKHRTLPSSCYHDLIINACSELGIGSEHVTKALKRAEDDHYAARKISTGRGWVPQGRLWEDRALWPDEEEPSWWTSESGVEKGHSLVEDEPWEKHTPRETWEDETVEEIERAQMPLYVDVNLGNIEHAVPDKAKREALI